MNASLIIVCRRCWRRTRILALRAATTWRLRLLLRIRSGLFFSIRMPSLYRFFMSIYFQFWDWTLNTSATQDGDVAGGLHNETTKLPPVFRQNISPGRFLCIHHAYLSHFLSTLSPRLHTFSLSVFIRLLYQDCRGDCMQEWCIITHISPLDCYR